MDLVMGFISNTFHGTMVCLRDAPAAGLSVVHQLTFVASSAQQKQSYARLCPVRLAYETVETRGL